jgi:Neuraminidase (sialidase)
MTIIRLRDHCRIVWNVDDRRGKFTGDWSVVDGFVRLFHRDHAKNGYSTASATTTDFDYD